MAATLCVGASETSSHSTISVVVDVLLVVSVDDEETCTCSS